MANVVYKPAEVLHWFEAETRRTNASAKAQTRDIARTAKGEGIIPGIKQAAEAAISAGKGAYGSVVQRVAEETRYDLFSQGFEVTDLTRKSKIGYDQIRQILAKPNDRFQILYNGGSLMIKPVAHLVAGKYRVPVGWIRNGAEVSYRTLIEELSARSGVEIDAE